MRGKRRQIFLLVLVIYTISMMQTACSIKGTEKRKDYKITIAEQFGLAYAPLQVVKELKLLEKNLPGVEVNWTQLGNTAAIREAMLANKVDTGFMAIPPFLIGWDKGMTWKIIGGLSSSPVGLVTYKESVKSIADFTSEDRIAVPQPGSIQHILLSMACEKEFGDAHKLDDLLVTLSHPDGMTALLAKRDITAHFTTPPYLYKELENKGMHQILDGRDAAGRDFTFIVGACTEKFHNDNPDVYKAFVKSLSEAIAFVNENPEKTSAMLSKIYNIPEDELVKYLTWEGMEYSQKVKGINTFAEFMKRYGYIAKTPSKASDIVWDDVEYEE